MGDVMSVARIVEGPQRRVAAVWDAYRRRGGRTDVRTRAYRVYLLVLIALPYGIALGHAVTSALQRVLGTAGQEIVQGAGYALVLCLCLLAQGVGRFWGPLVMPPFVLHVFLSTDLPLRSFLRPLAWRRVLGPLAVIGLPWCIVAIGLGVSGPDGVAWTVLAAVSGLMVAALVAAAWLWGQVGSLASNVALTTGLVVLFALGWMSADEGLLHLIPGLAFMGGSASLGAGIWGGLLVQAAVTVVLWCGALASVDSVDPQKLVRDSARADHARVFAGTGSFHEAVNVYRPRPGGRRTSLVHGDGRLRGHLVVGIRRMLRTPGRASAAWAGLIGGSFLMTTGVSGALPPGSPTTTLPWLAGALLVYLGTGWVSETWRVLRDELISEPLYGPAHGGVLGRNLAWILAAVPAGVGAGFLAASGCRAAGWLDAGPTDPWSPALVLASTVVALSARFMNEMKMDLPLQILTPVSTPFGDLSALVLLAWQFDSLILLASAVLLMDLLGPGLGGGLLMVMTTLACVHTGLKRVGRTPAIRLGRAPGIRAG